MSQVDVAHVGQGPRKPNTIGFVGGQHAGKSAVMNTISKHLPGWVNTPAYFKPVGRTNERGTVDLGVFERPDSDWKFIDTAGRGFNPQGEDADKAYLARVRRGLKEFTDLVNPTSTDPQHPGWALDTSADASNAMEAIVYVLNAELLVGTQAVVHQERYKLFWTKEVIEQKEALTITQVREHLKLFYQAVYALTGWYPFVVVTHMDTVAGKYSEAQIRDLLSAFVHEDRIFFMTCIKLPKDKLTEDTAAAVDELLDTLKGHVEFYRAKQQKNQASASAQVVAAVSPFAAASDLGPSAPNLPVVSV